MTYRLSIGSCFVTIAPSTWRSEARIARCQWMNWSCLEIFETYRLYHTQTIPNPSNWSPYLDISSGTTAKYFRIFSLVFGHARFAMNSDPSFRTPSKLSISGVFLGAHHMTQLAAIVIKLHAVLLPWEHSLPQYPNKIASLTLKCRSLPLFSTSRWPCFS